MTELSPFWTLQAARFERNTRWVRPLPHPPACSAMDSVPARSMAACFISDHRLFGFLHCHTARPLFPESTQGGRTLDCVDLGLANPFVPRRMRRSRFGVRRLGFVESTARTKRQSAQAMCPCYGPLAPAAAMACRVPGRSKHSSWFVRMKRVARWMASCSDMSPSLTSACNARRNPSRPCAA